MTLSDGRTDRIDHALRTLMARLGHRALSAYPFMPADPEFVDVLPTTWQELAHRGWTRSTGSLLYVLTGAGWKAGLNVTGQLDDHFLAMVFRLAAALKRHIAGKAEDAFVRVHDFEPRGIGAGFVFNVVESGLLEDLDTAKTYGLQWFDSDPWNATAPLFRIPRSFGQLRPLP